MTLFLNAHQRPDVILRGWPENESVIPQDMFLRVIIRERQKSEIPGESRDPPRNRSIVGQVDPGFRRECG